MKWEKKQRFTKLNVCNADLVGSHNAMRCKENRSFPRILLMSGSFILQGIMSDEQLENCPILILANKIDKHGAASETEIINNFELVNRLTGKVGEDTITYTRTN